MKNRKRVAISLAYLQNNLGDDLFVQHLCLRYPNIDFYVMELSQKNEMLKKLKNLHFSQKMKKFCKSYGLPIIPKRIKRFYKKFDACVMIGGSIFMQHNQYWHDNLRSFDNRVCLNPYTYILGANFGPFNDAAFLTEFGKSFTKVKDLCFRDSYSAAFFPDATNIRFAPDILFSYKYPIPEQKNQIAISLIDCCYNRPIAQLKRLKPCYDKYINKIVEMCSEIYKRGLDICLLSFCEKQGDLNVAKIIEKRCLQNGVTNVKICSYTGQANTILDEIASSKAVIATRFHAMVLGFLFKKPVYPIIYDEKQSNVLKDLNFFGESCCVENIDKINSAEVVDCLLDENSLNSYNAFEKAIKKAKQESEKQFIALDKILK